MKKQTKHTHNPITLFTKQEINLQHRSFLIGGAEEVLSALIGTEDVVDG